MSNPVVRPGSEEEWEALMRQLRQQAQGRPRPFLYARVQARLSTTAPWLPDWVRRPVYLALLGLLMLAMSGDATTLPPVVAANSYHSYQADLPPLPH